MQGGVPHTPSVVPDGTRGVGGVAGVGEGGGGVVGVGVVGVTVGGADTSVLAPASAIAAASVRPSEGALTPSAMVIANVCICARVKWGGRSATLVTNSRQCE